MFPGMNIKLQSPYFVNRDTEPPGSTANSTRFARSQGNAHKFITETAYFLIGERENRNVSAWNAAPRIRATSIGNGLKRRGCTWTCLEPLQTFHLVSLLDLHRGISRPLPTQWSTCTAVVLVAVGSRGNGAPFCGV